MKTSSKIIVSAFTGTALGIALSKLLRKDSPYKKLEKRKQKFIHAIDDKLMDDKLYLEEVKRSLQEQLDKVNDQINMLA